MADSEEECDTWRNRDKYPKEREASEKKASPSPVDQKTEKRPFNSYQSPNKSVEPPFKKQKSNLGDDSNNTNSGQFNNNRREGFENRRDNFENKKDNFDNRRDNFDNRKDNFDNRKDNFDNRKDNFDNRKDNFDNRKNNFDNRSNFENRKNNFDNRTENFNNRRDNFGSRDDNFNNRKDNRNENFENRNEGFENKRENFESRFPVNVSTRPNEEAPNYPTQPQMLLFKYFLQQQDDDIEMEAAMVKYNEYKEGFIKKQLKAFFETHSSQEWFSEKYLPIFLEANKVKESKNIASRKEIFVYLLERQWMNNIKLHADESDSIVRLMDAVVILLEGGNENDLKILDSRRYRSESPNDTFEKIIPIVKKADESITVVDTVVDENKESTAMDMPATDDKVDAEIKESDEPRALHKTFSIFLRNLHPNVLRSEIEALVKPYEGFLRLALQDPTPDRKFFRRGWVTYDRTVNIKEICWNLNNIRLHDCDIGAIVNRELTQRVRSANVLTNHKPVMRHDIKLASKLVAKFDKRYNLWPLEEGVICGNPMGSGNPLLKDITEYLVDEGSYEEEALLGGNLNCNLELTSSGADPTNITIENDDTLSKVLDNLVLYLRFVHSYDYYSNTEYQSEDDMPHRCGIMHARGPSVASDRPLSLKDVEDYIKAVEAKASVVLNSSDKLSVDDAKKLGYRNIEEVTEAFIQANTQELAKDKWLCPLSGKKFKGPDFVRKHILNKHMDKVDEATLAAHFFNNYLLDIKRPQLPEHPTNRPGAKVDGDVTMTVNMGDNKSGDFNQGRGNDGYNNRGMGRRNDDFDRRGSFRGSSPNNRDFGERNNNFDNRGGGNNGSFYRKNTFSGRGGPQGSRQRNGGGSYYSRNMTSYKDLDAPMDD